MDKKIIEEAKLKTFTETIKFLESRHVFIDPAVPLNAFIQGGFTADGAAKANLRNWEEAIRKTKKEMAEKSKKQKIGFTNQPK